MTRNHTSTLVAIALLFTAHPSALASEEPTGESATERAERVEAWRAPQHRLFYTNLLAARINPLGFQDRFELAYRYRLFDSDDLLFRDNFLGVATTALLTPAFSRVGLAAQVQPLSILYLEARWQSIQWFGNFHHLQTFSDVKADFSDAALETGQNGATTSWELNLTAELRAKVGPLVLRSRFTFIRTELTPPVTASDSLYYEPLYDLLMPTSGWALINDSDTLFFLLDDQLIVGTRYSYGYAFYDTNADIVPTHRVGPLVAYRFYNEPGTTFDAPTVLLLLQWYVRHPYGAGQLTSQAVPYVVVGFTFQGDLL